MLKTILKAIPVQLTSKNVQKRGKITIGRKQIEEVLLAANSIDPVDKRDLIKDSRKIQLNAGEQLSVVRRNINYDRIQETLRENPKLDILEVLRNYNPRTIYIAEKVMKDDDDDESDNATCPFTTDNLNR